MAAGDEDAGVEGEVDAGGFVGGVSEDGVEEGVAVWEEFQGAGEVAGCGGGGGGGGCGFCGFGFGFLRAGFFDFRF